MKKAATYFALTLGGVCWVVAAYFCHFYYTRYHEAVTDLEHRINSFDMRLATLEAHKSRELTPVRVWAVISTADRPPDNGLHFLRFAREAFRRFFRGYQREARAISAAGASFADGCN
jgi:hypothetical protein